METKIFLTVTALFLIISVYCQKPTIELTYTAIDNGTYIQLDSIKVMNRTQSTDTVLYWPDTVLDYQLGIPEINSNLERLQVFQNYPNPMIDQTIISLYVPAKDKVRMIVTDILGRVILKSDILLDRGTHSFRFTPGEGNLYFFTAQWRGNNSSIKILQTAASSFGKGSLDYMGNEASSPQLKTTEDIQSFIFNLGDTLLYIGYIDTLQSGMLDAPEASQIYTFQFATNIPCPEMPTVEYEGQVYNTIQIFSQCWLKENLNVGTMINGYDAMEDNGIMEKYCYNNEPDSCTKYGGLYQWGEMMQYTTQQGLQGICPPGWHLPTDEEWKVLEGAVDSQYGIGDNTWDVYGHRGFNAGTNLKTTSGWWYGGGNGTDLFGFSGLPGGERRSLGTFVSVSYDSYWWSLSESSIDYAWSRYLSCIHPEVIRYGNFKELGFSVRCLRD